MFNKILIPTDFSEASDCLLGCASELKEKGLEEVVLVHSVFVANTTGLEEVLKKEAAPELERQRKILETKNLKVITELVSGIPSYQIEQVASKYEVDAILIGSKGRGLSKYGIGSVSFKLLQITKFPVLLGRVKAVGQGDSCNMAALVNSLKHIIFPTDFSEASDRAFFYLKNIVREMESDVTVIHVCNERDCAGQSARIRKEQDSFVKKRLIEIKQDLSFANNSVNVEYLEGIPSEKIIELSREPQSPLIVMGNHGKGFIKAMILGSVANRVARDAESPVLFIPAKR